MQDEREGTDADTAPQDPDGPSAPEGDQEVENEGGEPSAPPATEGGEEDGA